MASKDRELDPASLAPADRSLHAALHKAVAQVGYDIGRFHPNTCVSALMEFMNAAYAWWALPESERPATAELSRHVAERFSGLLAPMAPHVAEELWRKIGHTESVFRSRWPEPDARALKADTFELVVQINGKVRARIPTLSGATEEQVRATALADPACLPWLEGKDVRKAVYVPGKLLNLVVS
jgi:leucyl-tRNA synthetase